MASLKVGKIYTDRIPGDSEKNVQRLKGYCPLNITAMIHAAILLNGRHFTSHLINFSG